MNGGWGWGLSYSETTGPISPTDKREERSERRGAGPSGRRCSAAVLGGTSPASRNPDGFTRPSVNREHTVSLDGGM